MPALHTPMCHGSNKPRKVLNKSLKTRIENKRCNLLVTRALYVYIIPPRSMHILGHDHCSGHDSCRVVWDFTECMQCCRDGSCGFGAFPTFGAKALKFTWQFDFELTYVGVGMLVSASLPFSMPFCATVQHLPFVCSHLYTLACGNTGLSKMATSSACCDTLNRGYATLIQSVCSHEY